MNRLQFPLAVAALAGVAMTSSPAVGQDLTLEYVGRYLCQCDQGRDHLMGVEQVLDHHVLVSSYTGLILLDLEQLPVDGHQEFVDYLPDLDLHSTVTLHDEFVYASIQRTGFAIIHLDQNELTLVDTRGEPGVFFGRMSINDNRLFVPAHAFGIRIYDLTNPLAPILIGSLTEGFADAWAIAADGDIAYVADGAGGLKIVDISDPANMSIIGGETVETATGTSEDILLIGDHVYVAAGGSGVCVYDRETLTRTCYETPTCAINIAPVGPHLAVSDIAGIEIFRIQPDGSLAHMTRERGMRRYRGENDLSMRLWHGVSGWNGDHVVVSDWDSVDLYRLAPEGTSAQPDITPSAQRLRLPPTGGSAEVELRNNGAGLLTIAGVQNPEPNFTVSLSQSTIPPGEAATLSIQYGGGQPGSTLLRVVSNDPDESPLPIEVFGETQHPDPGEPAPQFSLASWTYDHDAEEFNYGTFNLEDAKGQIFFFHVFGTW